MPFCATFNCPNRTGRKSKIQQLMKHTEDEVVTFHRFPVNPDQRHAWIEAVCRKDWQPTCNNCSYSKHFVKEEFDKSLLVVVRLHDHTVPSVFTKLPKQKFVTKRRYSDMTEKFSSKIFFSNACHMLKLITEYIWGGKKFN